MVSITIQLPKCAVDFIDFLRGLSGETREEWFRSTIARDLRGFVDDPASSWNEAWIKERFSLSAFLELPHSFFLWKIQKSVKGKS